MLSQDILLQMKICPIANKLAKDSPKPSINGQRLSHWFEQMAPSSAAKNSIKFKFKIVLNILICFFPRHPSLPYLPRYQPRHFLGVKTTQMRTCVISRPTVCVGSRKQGLQSAKFRFWYFLPNVSAAAAAGLRSTCFNKQFVKSKLRQTIQ